MCVCVCVCKVKRERLIIDNRIVYIRSLDRKLCLFEPATQGSQTWFALSHPAPVLHDLKKKKKKRRKVLFPCRATRREYSWNNRKSTCERISVVFLLLIAFAEIRTYCSEVKIILTKGNYFYVSFHCEHLAR